MSEPKRHIVVVTDRGSPMDHIVNYVLLNHGVALITVTSPDGRTTTLKVQVSSEDADSYATLNQWSKH